MLVQSELGEEYPIIKHVIRTGLAIALCATLVPAAAQVTGSMKAYQPVQIDFVGPTLSESGAWPQNPFLNYRGTLTVSPPAGPSIDIPMFFAGDGKSEDSSSTSGTVWRAFYTPSVAGQFNARVDFSYSSSTSISIDGGGGSAGFFDGEALQFSITAPDPSAPGNYARGLLRYAGQHYLQYDNGEYYIKAGADSPENFLGYYEFDNTTDMGGIATPGLVNGLHQYQSHAGDYGMNPFDSRDLWANGTKGKNILGALNYIASEGINSVYFLTYNTDGGDGRDTWPWIDFQNDKLHFDVSKLAQWDQVFNHMDKLGMQLHLITQEAENDEAMGFNGDLSNVRKLYYRELVARFAHHNALQWNLGEEHGPASGSSTTLDAEKAYAAWIRDLDPYQHPITVHTHYNDPLTKYPGLYGKADFEASSNQGAGDNYNTWSIQIREASAAAGRPWAVYGDEQGGPWSVDPYGGNFTTLRREVLWGNLMGGGAGVEWYFGYQGTFGDVQSEDWRFGSLETLWQYTDHAVEFFQEHLPFSKMAPDNALVSSSAAFCFASQGATYAVYLPSGGATDLTVAAGTYDVRWYNPRTGGVMRTGSVSQMVGPGRLSTGDNPAGDTQDWVVLVTAAKPTGGTVLSYGTGKLSSAGTSPYLTWTGAPDEGQFFRIQVRDGIPNSPGFVFWGTGQNHAPFFGGTLWVNTPQVRMRVFALNASGAGGLTIPVHSVMVGAQRNYQFWGRDPGYAPPNDIMLTDALEVEFGTP